MTEIKISAPRTSRFFSRKRVYTFQLPETWADIPQRLRLETMKSAFNRPYPQRFERICNRVGGIPRAILRSLTSAVAFDIYDSLEWIRNESVTEPIFPTVRVKGVTYHFPSEKMWNESAKAYAFADEYYTQFVATEDPKFLLLLMGVICRPEAKKPLHADDPRIPIDSRAEAEKRAEIFAKLDPVHAIATSLYFTGCKKYIHETYGPYIFTAEENSEPNIFGWWSTFWEIAKSQVFGNIEATSQQRMHTICQYLMKNKMDFDREKAKNPKTTAQ